MGKYVFRTLLCSFLFAALMHAPAWAETAVVTGSDVNVREGPGTGYRVIDCLPQGETVTVTDRSNAPWYCIEYEGMVGFMSASFLSIEEQESVQTSTDSTLQSILDQGQPGYVNSMYVRFRSGPGSEYSVLGEYNRGKPILYYGTIGDWAACFVDGRPGYLYAEYIALGYFSDGSESADSQSELPQNLRITQAQNPVQNPTQIPTPTPTAAVLQGNPSELLSLEHATTADVEQTPGYINANYVRFRKGPGSSYPIIGTYNIGKEIGVTGSYMEWTACLIDGAFGFIYSEYVTIPVEEPEEENVWIQEETVTEVNVSTIPMPAKCFGPIEGYVSGNSVRMRSAPTMAAPIVREVSYATPVTIVGATDDWAAVICNGNPGYIYGQFVKVGSFQLTNNTGTAQSYLSGSSYECGQQIAQYAVQFVGCPYSWGGRTPDGFDCSGFVSYVYEHFGITLSRVAQDQANDGIAVEGDLQPGDILCFYSGSSYIGHVGIYIGFGNFVHAQNSATGVVITGLTGHYADRGYVARRIV